MKKIAASELAGERRRPKKRDMLPVIQTIAIAITAIVTASSIALTYMSISLTREEQALMRDDREVQQNAARNDRFSRAIEHLSNDSLAIRMGALYELRNLGLEDEEYQEKIVRILSPFIRVGIERPIVDIYLACEITSLFWELTEHSVTLGRLQAEEVNLATIKLKGAYFISANLQKADLSYAHLQKANFMSANLQEANLGAAKLQEANLGAAKLQEADLQYADLQDANLQRADFRNAHLIYTAFKGADLSFANFQGTNLSDTYLQSARLSFADLQGANLRSAELHDVRNFTVEQLLEAIIDETTLLDDHLANDPRIKARIAELKVAEQAETPAE